MLKITIELHPHGRAENKRTLGVIDLWNDGSGALDTGNYKAKLYKFDLKSVWKAGEIKDFPRLKLGVYDLLYRVLREIVGFRNT